MKRLILLALVLAAGAVSAAPKADAERDKQVATTICAACHVADGNSGIAAYPKLAGQAVAYVYGQTMAIKDGTCTHGAAGVMKPMVMDLSERDTRDAATCYAKQQGKPGEANPKESPELGAKIYRGGPNAKELPACMSCRGPSGAGIPGDGTEIQAYPRLGGQHKAYVVEQVKAYQSGQHKNVIMADIVNHLSEGELNAAANSIQGLH